MVACRRPLLLCSLAAAGVVSSNIACRHLLFAANPPAQRRPSLAPAERSARHTEASLGLSAALAYVFPAAAEAFEVQPDALESLQLSAPNVAAFLLLIVLLLRPGLLFELIRLVKRHPSMESGQRMEAWNEPAFPFGNFAQHVTMCPMQSIAKMQSACQSQNGAAVDYRLLDPGVFIADNDAAVKELLSARVTVNAKRSLGENLPPYERLFGRALFMNSGNDWKRQQRIAAQGMSNRQMELAAPLVAAQVEEEFNRLELAISGSAELTSTAQAQMRKELGVDVDPDGKILLDPGEFMKNVVMRVLTHVAFGQGMDDADRNTILRCFNLFYEASLSPTIAVPGYVDSPLPGAKAMREAIEDLHGIGYKFIERERAKSRSEAPAEGCTLLSALLNARDEDNSSLSEEEVVHNVFGFMVAGIATTSDSLASSCFLLARHPAVQTKLQGELAAASSWDDIKAMPYLSAAITEQLRLWPPLIGVPPRTMSEDTTLAGLHCPKGTDVAIHGLAAHRRTSVWGEDAEEYCPDRFLQGEGSASGIKNPMLPSPLPQGVPDEAFLTFGGGVRPCIARPLAMIEMKLVWMQLLQRFDVLETEPEKFGMQIAFPVVFPKRDLRLQLVQRS